MTRFESVEIWNEIPTMKAAFWALKLPNCYKDTRKEIFVSAFLRIVGYELDGFQECLDEIEAVKEAYAENARRKKKKIPLKKSSTEDCEISARDIREMIKGLTSKDKNLAFMMTYRNLIKYPDEQVMGIVEQLVFQFNDSSKAKQEWIGNIVPGVYSTQEQEMGLYPILDRVDGAYVLRHVAKAEYFRKKVTRHITLESGILKFFEDGREGDASGLSITSLKPEGNAKQRAKKRAAMRSRLERERSDNGCWTRNGQSAEPEGDLILLMDKAKLEAEHIKKAKNDEKSNA